MPINSKNAIKPEVAAAPVGRPSKYTPQTIQLLEESAASGMSNKAACAIAGISQETLSQWRKEHEGFADRLEAAREKSRARALSAIQKAGGKDWKAHESWLKLTSIEHRPNAASMTAVTQIHNAPAQPQAIPKEVLAEIQRLRRIVTTGQAQPPVQPPAR